MLQPGQLTYLSDSMRRYLTSLRIIILKVKAAHLDLRGLEVFGQHALQGRDGRLHRLSQAQGCALQLLLQEVFSLLVLGSGTCALPAMWTSARKFACAAGLVLAEGCVARRSDQAI